jgi:hypothetical protein
LRKIFWEIFRTGKFSMENFPPHITKKATFLLNTVPLVSPIHVTCRRQIYYLKHKYSKLCRLSIQIASYLIFAAVRTCNLTRKKCDRNDDEFYEGNIIQNIQ